ncbi:LamG-like jellyroll fold domain-containing protein [Nannocystis sp.]|uniref:LamG-like jellyroll fold domain-containing protein n=1 Tax=Nannocystis sp. TaxID=1962667 RepID=UPI0025D00134|nr:LamG-like jellyroll fold domain-containing protein [Nannocystis sp.]MBK7826790.1 hypothetical protein [Nannocystis sp.]
MGIEQSITKDHPTQREGTVLGGQVYVRLPEMAVSFARGLVIQAWVRPDAQQTAAIVWLGGEGAKIVLYLMKDALALEWIDTQGAPHAVKVQVALPVGAWSRVAVALGPGGVTFFHGATAIAVPGAALLPRETARDGNAIGAQAGGGKGFVGAIGEVRLWNRSSGLDVILDRGARDLRGDEPGLVGWWTLEGAGGVADRSPFGRHGVLVGGAFKAGASSFAVQPTLDRCLDFGAGVGVVDLVIPRLRRAFTWQALVRVRDLAREATLLDATRDNLGLRVTLAKGVLKASVADKSGTVQCSSTQAIAANTWTSVALRLGDDGALTLFVNDAIVGAVAVSKLEVRSTRLGPGLDGQMAEVRFWSRALSSAEIADTSRRRIHAWAPGLVTCWRMDDEVLLPQAAPPNSAVTICSDRNFLGNKVVLLPGRYNWNQLGIGNDALSSISVPAAYLGLQVTVYADGNFTGKSTSYTRDTPQVADNDTASSIVVEGRRGIVDASLAGSCIAYVTDAQPAARDGLTLASAPLVIPPRVAGLGSALTLPDLPAVGTGGYSVQLWVNLDAALPSCSVLTLHGAGAVTVYQHENFGGASQALGVGKHDVSSLTIGNDQVSSIKVPLGLRAELWQHGGFKGDSWKYVSDAPSVRDANDQASSIIVESLPVIEILATKIGDSFTLSLGGLVFSTYNGLDLGVSLTPRRWTHVSITHSADGLLCVYADGRLVRRLDVAPLPARTLAPVVGPFVGSIAELRLWSRALTRDEIEGNWQQREGAGAGLVGRWPFAADLSGGPSEAKGTVIWREAPGLAFKRPSAELQATIKARASFLADQTGAKQAPQLCVNLSALDARGQPLPLTKITVVSSSSVALYRNTVRPENRITDPKCFEIDTDARGVARLALQPAALSAPILKVRHDGMSEGEWALVTPDQVLHEALASLTVSEVKQGRRATATSKGGARGLCTDGAEELVAILRGMLGAAAAFSFEAESTAGLAFGDLEDQPAPVLLTPVGDGAQTQVIPVAEDAVLVRRLGRPIAAVTPIDSDEGPVSFGLVDTVLSITRKIIEEVGDTAEAVATKVVELGMETVENLGNPISSAIVDSLTFAVNATIGGFKVAANWVVKTVEDIAVALVDLFKKIGKTLGDVLDYLAELFDWSDILDTANQMLSDAKGSVATVKGGVNVVFATIRAKIRTIQNLALVALGGQAQLPASAVEARSEGKNTPFPEIPSLLDFLLSLLPDTPFVQMIEDAMAIFDPIKDQISSAIGRLAHIGDGLGAVWNDPKLQASLKDPRKFLDGDPSDWLSLAQMLVLIVANCTDLAVDFVGDLTVAFIDSFERLLNLHLQIPVLTEFVEKHVLGGAKLTVGMLFCLVAAIPTTVLYKTITGSKDGPAALRSGPMSFGADDAPSGPTWWDISTRSIDLVATVYGGLVDIWDSLIDKDPPMPVLVVKYIADGINMFNGGVAMGVDLADNDDWERGDRWKFGFDATSWVLSLVSFIAAGINLFAKEEATKKTANKVGNIFGGVSEGLGLISGIMDVCFTASDDESSAGDVWISSLDLSGTVGGSVAGFAGMVPKEAAKDGLSKTIRVGCIIGGNALNVGCKVAALGVVIGQKVD